MSSSIAIPKRKQLATPSIATSSSASSPAPGSYYSPLSATSSYASSLSPSSPGISGLEARRLGKSKAREGAAQDHRSWERRPSLLGVSFSKSEYTVVNLATSDGAPRLVTCVKSSQGFDWNQELFLPSYMEIDSSDLERRPDPVHDVVLTEEEAAALMP